ncbi:hypothetical protein HSE3_gp025 [Klebsiella phage vB_KleS-HSE3]|nr:hypothetical protein HSE3_gp025 [Klebsiella phage vB_KleS-HSE3]
MVAGPEHRSIEGRQAYAQAGANHRHRWRRVSLRLLAVHRRRLPGGLRIVLILHKHGCRRACPVATLLEVLSQRAAVWGS